MRNSHICFWCGDPFSVTDILHTDFNHKTGHVDSIHQKCLMARRLMDEIAGVMDVKPLSTKGMQVRNPNKFIITKHGS